MALVRRSRPELEWPDWFFNRFGIDWPEFFGDSDEMALRVEEYREEDEHVVRAEMPGLDPEKDVEITVSDNMLRIKAERRRSQETSDKRGYRSEFRYGSFVRNVPLPPGASEEDVKASYNDGILMVRIPIDTRREGARKIEIERG